MILTQTEFWFICLIVAPLSLLPTALLLWILRTEEREERRWEDDR